MIAGLEARGVFRIEPANVCTEARSGPANVDRAGRAGRVVSGQNYT
jgi:hypothetical protein